MELLAGKNCMKYARAFSSSDLWDQSLNALSLIGAAILDRLTI